MFLLPHRKHCYKYHNQKQLLPSFVPTFSLPLFSKQNNAPQEISKAAAPTPAICPIFFLVIVKLLSDFLPLNSSVQHHPFTCYSMQHCTHGVSSSQEQSVQARSATLHFLNVLTRFAAPNLVRSTASKQICAHPSERSL